MLDIFSQIAGWFASGFISQAQTQIASFVTTALSGNMQSIGVVLLLGGIVATTGGSLLSGTGEVAKAIGKPLIVLGVILLVISFVHP